MCGKNLAFWYCTLFLFVIMSLKSEQPIIPIFNIRNFPRIIKRNGFTTNHVDVKELPHDSCAKSTNNTQYNMQYEYRTASMNNDNENDDRKQRIKEELHEIITESEEVLYEIPQTEEVLYEIIPETEEVLHEMPEIEEVTTSKEVLYEIITETENTSLKYKFENSNKDKNIGDIIPYESCINIICIQLCFPFGYYLNYTELISTKNKYIFPNVYEYMNDSSQNINKTVDKLFPLTVHDPCRDKDRLLFSNDYDNYDYKLIVNGSLYLPIFEIFANSTSYCLIANRENKYEVSICLENFDNNFENRNYKIYNYVKKHEKIRISYCIVSIPFLMSIFVVYSILPELRNTHGFMLCNYSGALSVAYIIGFILIPVEATVIPSVYISIIVFLKYFFFGASFFWLNIMSFDMWWTFKGFYSLQRNVGQRKKMKLVFYSISAWSLSLILAIISIVMDILLKERIMFTPYYYGFQSICIISSICLSISTALKIARYEKETCNRLANSENKRYNDNKKWSNLYLKLFILLFILMGIKWSVMTLLLIYKYLSLFKKILLAQYADYFIYVILLMDIMQNACAFIVFVLKKKIMRMLLKRFGCGFRSAINVTLPSSKSICTTTLEEMPMQKKMSFGEQRICHKKDS